MEEKTLASHHAWYSNVAKRLWMVKRDLKSRQGNAYSKSIFASHHACYNNENQDHAHCKKSFSNVRSFTVCGDVLHIVVVASVLMSR